jgi:fatty-acid desaturase
MSAYDGSKPPNDSAAIEPHGIEARRGRVRAHGHRTGARHTIAWPYASGIVGYHVLALLALVPWFFTWGGVILAVAGLFVFGTLGINLGYHRLLTHRGLICPKWLERTFVILGVCCVQDTPARWVSVHRLHH